MPKEFEDMRKKIKAQLKKDNPKLSDKELDSRSYAIATAQWKKSHGGKLPQASDLILVEYEVPITEFTRGEVEEFKIKGIAINETTTSNNHKFLAEELKKSVGSMIGVPLLKDHINSVDSIIGRVNNANFDELNKNISFEAVVKEKKYQEMIKDGRINSVSVGAQVKPEDIQEGENGELIPTNIVFKELSLVAIPADTGATFGIALRQAYHNRITELEDKLYSTDVESIELKGGSKMTDEKSLKETSQEEVKVEESVEESKVEKKEQNLDEKISKLVDAKMEKLMEEISALRQERAKMSAVEEDKKPEVKEVKEPEVKEKKEKSKKVKESVELEVEAEDSKYKFQEGTGTLKGGSYTIIR